MDRINAINNKGIENLKAEHGFGFPCETENKKNENRSNEITAGALLTSTFSELTSFVLELAVVRNYLEDGFDSYICKIP